MITLRFTLKKLGGEIKENSGQIGQSQTFLQNAETLKTKKIQISASPNRIKEELRNSWEKLGNY
jgi:hypothetical protein